MARKVPNEIHWKQVIFAILLCQGAGIIGSLFTFEAIPTWYQTISKPSFTPPNFVFGPVWTLLYLLMGISLYMIWQEKKTKARDFALKIFYTQLILNTSWSIIFFGVKELWFASLIIGLLWVLILLTILCFYKINKTASYLLIPYILWVSFATILNLSIAMLN